MFLTAFLVNRRTSYSKGQSVYVIESDSERESESDREREIEIERNDFVCKVGFD